MSYNSQANSKKNKKSMYLKKKIDASIPQNIMTLICNWIDCYNSNIMELTKIQMHFEFEEKINDTSYKTGRISQSSSSRRSETDKVKYEKEIFDWLSSLSEKDFEYYSEKISEHLNMNKDYIIKITNSIRSEKKKPVFKKSQSSQPSQPSQLSQPYQPYQPSQSSQSSQRSQSYQPSQPSQSKISYSEEKEQKIEKKDKNGKIIYGDAWDLI